MISLLVVWMCLLAILLTPVQLSDRYCITSRYRHATWRYDKTSGKWRVLRIHMQGGGTTCGFVN